MWQHFVTVAHSDEAAPPPSPVATTVRRILSDPANKALKDFVMASATAMSYAPGRSAEDVAYREGYRAFALRMLSMYETPDAK